MKVRIEREPSEALMDAIGQAINEHCGLDFLEEHEDVMDGIIPVIARKAQALTDAEPAEETIAEPCQHGVVGGCLRDDEPTEAGDVGRDEEAEMLPCPSCKAEGRGVHLDMIPYAPLNQFGEFTSDYSGRCCECWMIGPRKKTLAAALSAWNALPRAPTQPDAEALRRFRDKLLYALRKPSQLREASLQVLLADMDEAITGKREPMVAQQERKAK